MYRRYGTTIKRYPNMTFDRIQPAARNGAGEVEPSERLLDNDGICRCVGRRACVCGDAGGTRVDGLVKPVYDLVKLYLTSLRPCQTVLEQSLPFEPLFEPP